MHSFGTPCDPDNGRDLGHGREHDRVQWVVSSGYGQCPCPIAVATLTTVAAITVNILKYDGHKTYFEKWSETYFGRKHTLSMFFDRPEFLDVDLRKVKFY